MKEHCHNNRKAPLPGYWAQDGYHLGQLGKPIEPRYVWVPFRMSLECQQPGPGFPVLPGCVGCEELNV